VSDVELAEVLLERLSDFSPALSIEPGEDAGQVVVEDRHEPDSRCGRARDTGVTST
jgi:hypothetical protein